MYTYPDDSVLDSLPCTNVLTFLTISSTNTREKLNILPVTSPRIPEALGWF